MCIVFLWQFQQNLNTYSTVGITCVCGWTLNKKKLATCKNYSINNHICRLFIIPKQITSYTRHYYCAFSVVILRYKWWIQIIGILSINVLNDKLIKGNIYLIYVKSDLNNSRINIPYLHMFLVDTCHKGNQYPSKTVNIIFKVISHEFGAKTITKIIGYHFLICCLVKRMVLRRKTCVFLIIDLTL